MTRHTGPELLWFAFIGVLDVAGGRGDVGLCLLALHGVRCTTIDPRPRKLAHKLSYSQRRLLAPWHPPASQVAALDSTQHGLLNSGCRDLVAVADMECATSQAPGVACASCL